VAVLIFFVQRATLGKEVSSELIMLLNQLF